MNLRLVCHREIEVPNGATHCSKISDIDDCPVFYKKTVINECDHWWNYDFKEKQWYLYGHHEPHWMIPLPVQDVLVKYVENQE